MNFFRKIYNDYFCVNLKDYDKIGIDLEINKILLFLFLGLIAATVFISITSANTSLLLKKLLRSDAFSEEKAKKLSELGLSDNRAVKSLLSKGSGPIDKIIRFVGYQKPTYEEYVEYQNQQKKAKYKPNSGEKYDKKSISDESIDRISISPDLSSVSIYIDPEKKDYAERIYKINSTSITKTVLSCLAILAFYLLIFFLMPGILSLINGIL